MEVVKFIWDNQVSEDISNRDLIIGVKLPNKYHNPEKTHIETYGICLSVVDTKKDFRLHRHSCYRGNMTEDAKNITKEQARKILIEEIDKALEIMFNESKHEDIDGKLFEIESEGTITIEEED